MTEMTNTFLGITKSSEDQPAEGPAKPANLNSTINKWKKIDRPPQINPAATDDTRADDEVKEKKSGVSIEELIDLELDGEPMTESDEDDDEAEK